MSKAALLKLPTHSRWRMDVDYWDKLSSAERDYLAKFLAEYYNSARHGRHQELHAAQRDIVTLDPALIPDLLKPTQRAYYTPDDYKEPSYALAPSARQGSRHRDD